MINIFDAFDVVLQGVLSVSILFCADGHNKTVKQTLCHTKKGLWKLIL